MKTKKVWKTFSIFAYEKEQAYLRKMHNAGWKLRRISGLNLYTFEVCAPEDVIYQLDYNPQTDMDKAEYLQMFEDCGWEYIQDYAQYSYFRKPASAMEGPEEIFCDDDSRAQMLLRIFKHRYLPFAIILLVNTIIGVFRFIRYPFLHPYIIVGVIVYVDCVITYIVLLIRFIIRYRQFKNRR